MKNRIYRASRIMAVVITLFTASSCEKYLEVPLPVNSITTEGAFGSKSVIDKMMYNMYYGFTEKLVVPSWQSRHWECFADNFYNPTATGTIQATQESNVQAKQQSSNMLDWPATYDVIFMTNTLIEGLPEASAVGLDEETRNAYIAAAKTVRAYAYFMLVRVFGEVPLVTSTNVEETKFLGRSTVAEIFALIESDLIEAINGLPEEIGEPYFITCKYIPQAILANVYLTEGKWAEAEDAASSVIGSGNYQLDADLNSVFKQTSAETIMATGYCLDFYGIGARTAYNAGWVTLPAGWSVAWGETNYPALSEDLITSFETGDQRKDKWVILVNTLGYPNPNNRMFQYKYRYSSLLNRLPPAGLEDDNKFIRLAEIYLIRAEARARKASPDLAGAANDLNMIRNRAGLANTTAASQSDLVEAILHERRVELFFEKGTRWFDLVRTGKADAVLSTIPFKSTNWKPYMVLAPIPQEELNKNINLLPQNQGW